MYKRQLYADLVAGRVDETVLGQVLEAAQVYPDDRQRILEAWRAVPRADPVRRIFIHLDRLTPPAYFARYGPRVVPVFNYFQAALVLLADGELNPGQVARVAVEMVQTAGHNLLTLSNSFQDLVRRGLPIQSVAAPLLQALEGALQGPGAVLQAFRPLPDIVKAFTRRVAALGATPPPPEPRQIDYLSVLDDARPRTHRARKRSGEPA